MMITLTHQAEWQEVCHLDSSAVELAVLILGPYQAKVWHVVNHLHTVDGISDVDVWNWTLEHMEAVVDQGNSMVSYYRAIDDAETAIKMHAGV